MKTLPKITSTRLEDYPGPINAGVYMNVRTQHLELGQHEHRYMVSTREAGLAGASILGQAMGQLSAMQLEVDILEAGIRHRWGVDPKTGKKI